MVSSPTATINEKSENNIVVREVIGRLCNSDYNIFPSLASLAPFSTERAATFYCLNIEIPPKLDGAAKNDKNKFSTSSTPDDSTENSSLSEQIPIDTYSRKRKSILKGNKGKEPSAPTPAKHPNSIASEKSESNAKRSKSEDEKDAANRKQSKDNNNNNNSKPPEAPKDYIHVRARRGQATDSHSLAERVRREKISERMKVLQDLVPGCNKVTGKAVMLDEIINYVESLQRQVEFLSMKLDFNMEALMSNSKDMFQSRGSLPHNIYPSDSYPFLSQQNTHTAIPSPSFGRNQSMQMPPMDNFSASQVSTFWEDDLNSVVQMGFGQNQTQDLHGL